MSSIVGCASSEPRQSTAIVPPPSPNLGDLPQELRNQIFCRLSPPDLQAVASVSWGMNRSVIEAANFNEFHSLKKFIKILMQTLPEQKERLVEIAQNRFFQDFANLLLLKRSILDVKAQLIGVIKTVDAETADDLHDVQPPHFLENIFTLAALERQIDEAHLIPDEKDRGHALWGISKALTREGDIDKALAVATSITHEYCRGIALGDISQALTRRGGDMDRSLVVAKLIPEEGTRVNAVWAISIALARAGDIDKAIVVAQSIPFDGMRGDALRDIAIALKQAGKIDRARAVAQLIRDSETRRNTLRDISFLY